MERMSSCRGNASNRFPDDMLGAVAFSRIDEIDSAFESESHQADGFFFRFAVLQPQTARPPQPSPATLTLKPVRPKIVYSMSSITPV